VSENLFHRDFWLGEADARPPALLRIGVGTLVASDLVDRLRDFYAFYAPGGILPGPGEGPHGIFQLSLFGLAHTRAAALALFLAGIPLAAAFAVGYRARLASVLLWIFMVSLERRNPVVCDGGDMVVLVLLFWMMFTDTGAALSLDVRLGRRPGRATVRAIGLRMLQLQVALIYVATFLAKNGPSWHDGSAVLHALGTSDWSRGLGHALTAHPGICRALTWATLAIEGSFAFLALSPFRTGLTRALALGSGLALHAGIFLTMRVGIFSQVMPVSYVVFLPAPWLDRAEAWLARRRGHAPPARPAPPASARPQGAPAPAAVAVAVALSAQLALVAVDQGLRLAHKPTPRVAALELTLVNQRQNWRMFAPDVPVDDISWRAPGELGDGSRVELTEAVIPELAKHGGFRYSRWHRLRNSLALKAPDLLLPLGRYICRRWSAMHPDVALARFDLVARARPIFSTEPPHEAVLFKQACAADAPSIH
jgi:hypothetical protein